MGSRVKRETAAATPEVGRSEPAGAAAVRDVLALQRSVGNRATAMLLRQTPPGGGSSSGRRVVVLDGTILDEIHRGNRAIANKLTSLLKTAHVYISHAAYEQQVTNRAIPRLGTATRLILTELGIRTTPPAKPADLADVQARNTLSRNRAVLQPNDVLVAADAKSINGEVWSVDDAFHRNADSVRKTVGVKVAAESEQIASVGKGAKAPQQDYRVGRSLLGLEPVEISLSGKVTRPSPTGPPAGTGAGSGSGAGAGGQPPATGKATGAGGATKPTRMGSVRMRTFGRVGGVAAGAGVLLLLGFLEAKIRARWEERRIQDALVKLQPTIDAAIEARQAEFDKLLEQTERRKMIYANIQLDQIWWQMMGDPDTPPDYSFHELKLVDVRLSTNDINAEGRIRRERIAFGSYLDHRLYTMSWPVFNPLSEVFEQGKRWLKEHPEYIDVFGRVFGKP